MTAPILWIIAGANGVGKTTFAMNEITSLSGSFDFVNLDLIARGLSPFDPDRETLRAARIALEMMRDLISRGATFAIETTLAGQGHKRLIREAQAAGYSTNLLYFFVSSPEESLRRIARRVEGGGHDVPARDVRRRFQRSSEQFPAYARLCHFWRIFDTEEPVPRLRAEGKFENVDLLFREDGPVFPAPIARFLKA